jgi:hypothetical protein
MKGNILFSLGQNKRFVLEPLENSFCTGFHWTAGTTATSLSFPVGF